MVESQELEGGAFNFKFTSDSMHTMTQALRKELRHAFNELPGRNLLASSHEFLNKDPVEQSDPSKPKLTRPVVR